MLNTCVFLSKLCFHNLSGFREDNKRSKQWYNKFMVFTSSHSQNSDDLNHKKSLSENISTLFHATLKHSSILSF